MKFAGAHYSNESKWLELKVGHQDSSPSNHHQGKIAYYDKPQLYADSLIAPLDVR